jgi:hypothetical protein
MYLLYVLLLELVGIALGMFVKLGLVKLEDDTSLSILIDFLEDVRIGYLDNPYHCFHHAIDVAFVVFYMLEVMGVQRLLGLSKVDVAALLIAALAHDILHTGLNNLYQVTTLLLWENRPISKARS